MHTTAQSMHEYVWHVKLDQGERNGQLGRLNSRSRIVFDVRTTYPLVYM